MFFTAIILLANTASCSEQKKGELIVFPGMILQNIICTMQMTITDPGNSVLYKTINNAFVILEFPRNGEEQWVHKTDTKVAGIVQHP